MWYNPSSMVNILAWCDINQHFRITADTAYSSAIKVHLSDDEIVEFEEFGNGLYICDGSRFLTNKSTVSPYSSNSSPFTSLEYGTSLANLVSDNKANFVFPKLLGLVARSKTQGCAL